MIVKHSFLVFESCVHQNLGKFLHYQNIFYFAILTFSVFLYQLYFLAFFLPFSIAFPEKAVFNHLQKPFTS